MASEKIERTLAWLDAHGIEYQVHYHPPLFTIEEALAYWKDIDSTHCKNLFMRNHKGNRHAHQQDGDLHSATIWSASNATRALTSTASSTCCIRAN